MLRGLKNNLKINKPMRNKQWYESLFQDYGQTYDSENFTQGTIGECDFIEIELNSDRTFKILDVGCGTGTQLALYKRPAACSQDLTCRLPCLLLHG